jgi:hypothetical protein
MCHHRCGGILGGGVTFVVKYGQLSTLRPKASKINYGNENLKRDFMPF